MTPAIRTSQLLYASLATCLLASSVYSYAWILERTFPGFLVFENGVVAALSAPDWTGVAHQIPLNGSRIEWIDDQPFEDGQTLLQKTSDLEPGTEIRYGIRDGDSLLEIVVPVMKLSFRESLSTFGVYVLVALVLMGTGAIALILQPEKVAARALASALGILGALFALSIDHFTTYRFVYPYILLEAIAPAATLHLALVFPRERASYRTRRILVSTIAFIGLIGAGWKMRVFATEPEFAWAFDSACYGSIALAGIGIVASFAESFVRGTSPQARSRAALVLFGGIVGVVIPALAVISFFALGLEVSTIWWTPFIGIFALVLGYAGLRHNLFQAERMIRLSVGYAIVSSCALAVYTGVLITTGGAVWSRDWPHNAVPFLALIAIAIAFEPGRRRAQLTIDRLFYRSNVDVASVLETCAVDLAAVETLAEIAVRLETLISESIRPEWTRVRFFKNSSPDQAILSEAIVFRGELLGHIDCGTKASGAPYSDAERELLTGIASQSALAIHNARTISELREAQDALLRSERLAVIGEFAGAVAHGIRNPLAGIRAAAQVAHGRAGDGELAESIAGVLSEADRLDHRIGRLLDFSRPYRPVRRPGNLAEVVEAVTQAVTPNARRQGVNFSSSVPVEPVWASIDPLYVEEALLELCANSLRAVQKGGSITVALSQSDRTAVLRVTDTGGGVPLGVRHRVFDLFFTTRREGSGIGLATVRKIVEQHDGQIALEFSDDSGSGFKIELPVVDAEDEATRS